MGNDGALVVKMAVAVLAATVVVTVRLGSGQRGQNGEESGRLHCNGSCFVLISVIRRSMSLNPGSESCKPVRRKDEVL